MTATAETMNGAPSDVDAMKKENFHAATAMDLLEEAGLSDLDNAFFANDLKGISDLVTAGGAQDLELAKRMHDRLNDDINWAKTRGDNKISDAQAEAIGDLLAAAIGDEGIAKLDGTSGELFDKSDDEKLIEGGDAVVKQAIADRDADAVLDAYKSVAEAIASAGGDIDSRNKLFLKFLDKTAEGVSKEDHEWLDAINLDEKELANIVRGNKTEVTDSIENKKPAFDTERAKARLDEAGLKDADSLAFSNDIGLITDLTASDNKLDMLDAKIKHDSIMSSIEWAIGEGRIDEFQSEAVKDLLAKSVGREGLENIDAVTKRLDSINEGLVSSGLFSAEEAKAIYEQVWKFVTAKEAKDADGLNEAFENIKTSIDESTEDEDERRSKINEIMDYSDLYGKTLPNLDGSDGPEVDAADYKRALDASKTRDLDNSGEDEDEDNETDPQTRRERAKNWMKRRWTKLKTAFYNRDVKLAAEAVFGNEDGEKTKRNALIALGVGAAALALLIAANKKGFDFNPFDSSPSDTGTGGSTTGSKTGAAVDVDFSAGPGLEAPQHNPSDYGINLNTDMPWDIANKVAPGNENTALQNMVDTYSNQIGQPVTLNSSGLISVGDHITTPTELSQMNDILFNQLV